MEELKNTIEITENHIIQENASDKPKSVKNNRKKSEKIVNCCDICVEKYNKSTKTPIKCEYCDFVACKECCKKYLLLEIEQKCMNGECKRPWTSEFISKNFAKTFINNELKSHKEKILFDKQKALMPSTQPIIENIIKKEEYVKKIKVAIDEVAKAKNKMYNLQREYRQFLNTNNTVRKTFIRACPDENCRGFLSSQWKCGLCEQWTCPTCHEVKGKEKDCEHECKPENVATAKLLNTDTKPCPKCGYGIFKIEGCDQMWCTQCHTAFSWRTGHIETNIHNPHYYEWVRRNGTLPRNTNDIECGREITHHIICRIREYYYSLQYYKSNDNYFKYEKEIKDLFNKMYDVCRTIIHIRHVSIPRYRDDSDGVFQHLRIKYMRNFITEEKFKMLLQKEYKRANKYKEISEVLTLLINTMTDIIYRFMEEVKDKNWKYNLDRANELDEIIKYANECFLKISKTYDSIPLTYERL